MQSQTNNTKEVHTQDHNDDRRFKRLLITILMGLGGAISGAIGARILNDLFYIRPVFSATDNAIRAGFGTFFVGGAAGFLEYKIGLFASQKHQPLACHDLKSPDCGIAALSLASTVFMVLEIPGILLGNSIDQAAKDDPSTKQLVGSAVIGSGACLIAIVTIIGLIQIGQAIFLKCQQNGSHEKLDSEKDESETTSYTPPSIHAKTGP